MKTAVFDWRSPSATHYLVRFSLWDRIKLLFRGICTISIHPDKNTIDQVSHLLQVYYPSRWAHIQAGEVFYAENENQLDPLLEYYRFKYKLVGVVFCRDRFILRFGNYENSIRR